MTDDRASAGARTTISPATRRAVVAAALPHVAFDGWTDRTLAQRRRGRRASMPGLSRLAFPRGGVDLALAYPRRARTPSSRPARRASDLARAAVSRPDRPRDRAAARARRGRPRGGAPRRGAVRAAEPCRRRRARDLAHGGHDLDRARRQQPPTINWYTKRTTLSAVYSSCLLYWLGDDSPELRRPASSSSAASTTSCSSRR